MTYKKLTYCLAMVAFLMMTGLPTQAGMVGTAQMQEIAGIAAPSNSVAQRNWIEAQLLQGGVGQAEASTRVAAMTDVEVAQIYQRIDEAPAGGSSFLLIALVVFVVLEITGYIDVIPEN